MAGSGEFLGDSFEAGSLSELARSTAGNSSSFSSAEDAEGL